MGFFDRFSVSKDEFKALKRHSSKQTLENKTLSNRIAELEAQLQEKEEMPVQSVTDTLMKLQNENMKKDMQHLKKSLGLNIKK